MLDAIVLDQYFLLYTYDWYKHILHIRLIFPCLDFLKKKAKLRLFLANTKFFLIFFLYL